MNDILFAVGDKRPKPTATELTKAFYKDNKFTQEQIEQRKVELGLVGLENYVPAASKGSFVFTTSPSHPKEQEIQLMVIEIYNDYHDKEKEKYHKSSTIKRELCRMIKSLILELQNYQPEEHDDYNIIDALRESQVYNLFHFANCLTTYDGREEYHIKDSVIRKAYKRLVEISGCSAVIKPCQCKKCTMTEEEYRADLVNTVKKCLNDQGLPDLKVTFTSDSPLIIRIRLPDIPCEVFIEKQGLSFKGTLVDNGRTMGTVKEDSIESVISHLAPNIHGAIEYHTKK